MKRKYNTTTSFIDFLFIYLVAFICLFALAMVNIKIENKKKNVEAKAEFIITITWPSDSKDDVDTYLEDPVGNIVFYQQKQKGLMHLDRDDLGHANDMITGPDGQEYEYRENREMVTLRGVVQGEYTLNIHMYNKWPNNSATPVTITIEKLNPFSQVFAKTIQINASGEEVTVCRFTINEEGDVKNINDLPKRFIGNIGPVAPTGRN